MTHGPQFDNSVFRIPLHNILAKKEIFVWVTYIHTHILYLI